MPAFPPDELTEGAVTLRRFTVDDAESLLEAITASAEHIRPWMPWIADGKPLPLPQQVELIEKWTTAWNDRLQFQYRIGERDDPELTVGACGLHARIGPGALEIGYWVRPDRTRRGIATTAVRLLTSAALGLGDVDHVEIHHDRANVASRGIPEGLGYAFTDERPDDGTTPGPAGVKLVWRMTSTTWQAS